MSIKFNRPVDMGSQRVTALGTPSVGTDAATKDYVDTSIAGLGGGGGDVLTGDTGQNASLVAGNRKEVTFSTTIAADVASTDVSNYRWVSVHITSQGTSSNITFQGSNDNTNWLSVPLMTTTSTAGPVVTSSSAAGAILHGPLNFRYFRLHVTGISAGTTAGVVEFFAIPGAMQGLGVTVVGTPSVSIAALTSVGSNKATVTTAGTRVQLASNACSSVTVKAKISNAGLIYVGGSTVSATNGFELSPGDSMSLDVNNTSLVYIDAATNGDGLSYLWTA